MTKDEAIRLAQEVVDNDWEDDRIDRDSAFESNWVAELDEEKLVEDLLNVPEDKLVDTIDKLFED